MEEKQEPLADLENGDKEVSKNDDIIVANNVHKTYLLGVEGVPALRGVSLRIKRGEFICILGKSGGGKTSLLNLLGTIDNPTKGDITIAGKRITSNTTDEEFAYLRLRKIGFVFQTFNLIASMTAAENVALPMVLDGRLSVTAIKARALELLTSVGLGSRADHLPSQLSGGEQQRTTIARAIANDPSILLLDEPTGDLDTHNSHVVLQMLLNLNRRKNITCIMVTHDQDLKRYAHRVVHMMDGKVLRIEAIPETTRADSDRALQKLILEEKEAKATKPTLVTEYRTESMYKFHKVVKAAA
jgi:putative ABC transport system ATP-binding protein